MHWNTLKMPKKWLKGRKVSKTKIEKRWLPARISPYFDIYCGSIDSLIGQLTDIKKEYEEKGFREITIDFGGMHEGMDPTIYANRLETNEEFEQRIKREEERAKKEEGDRKEWERLKKKYGG